MFVVTNRKVLERKTGFEQMGSSISEKGPAELRMVEVVRKGRGWDVTILPDTITDEMKQAVGITKPGKVFASAYVYRRLMAVINPRSNKPGGRTKGKDLVLFVHGFNNDFQDVVERCHGLSETYGVEVIAFSWPANGGGFKGVTDYLDDKRDAQASVVAFDRVLAKLNDYLAEARSQFLGDLTTEAEARFPQDRDGPREFIARTAERDCPFSVSLLLHSMGNYLFERTLKSSALRGGVLVFDNIIMAAADVNNPDHAQWVEQIQMRNRLYITINEDDSALRASRMKGGGEQLARLGHYPYDLSARQAVYVDFTNADNVGDSHAYFEDQPLRNPKVKSFFQHALHGERAEDAELLQYDASRNLHRLL